MSMSLSNPNVKQTLTAVPGTWALVVFALILGAGMLMTPYDPTQADFLNRLATPSAEHWFGTDHLGRDIATRVLYGSFWSLGLSLGVVSIGAAIGTIVGLGAAQNGRWADMILMRTTDSFFAFPELISAVTIAGLFGPSTMNLVLALIVVSWMKFARLVRSLAIRVVQQDYILQARLNGLPASRVLWQHILPNILPGVFVLWTNSWSRTILAISGLSFLGFGVQPPNAEWGAMLLDGKAYLLTAPHIMIFPGLAVLLAVLTINLTGDRWRDRLAENI